jgi:hypothetical protein
MGLAGVIRVRPSGVAVDPGGVRQSALEAAVSSQTPRKPLLCRLNLHHKWVRRFYENGDDYRHCEARGKEARTVRLGRSQQDHPEDKLYGDYRN